MSDTTIRQRSSIKSNQEKKATFGVFFLTTEYVRAYVWSMKGLQVRACMKRATIIPATLLYLVTRVMHMARCTCIEARQTVRSESGYIHKKELALVEGFRQTSDWRIWMGNIYQREPKLCQTALAQQRLYVYITHCTLSWEAKVMPLPIIVYFFNQLFHLKILHISEKYFCSIRWFVGKTCSLLGRYFRRTIKHCMLYLLCSFWSKQHFFRE